MSTTIKPKPCANCGSIWHSAMYHKPRKPLAIKKPMRKEAVKTQEQRLAATEAWFEANPPDPQGRWLCYISKHPLCPIYVNRKTINLEHDISKARGPGLKYDITNLYPACSFDNKAKGSLSAEEYLGGAQQNQTSK